MQHKRMAYLVLGLGLALSAAAVAVYEFDLVPSLSPSVVEVVFFRLVFYGIIGVLAGGALLASGILRDIRSPGDRHGEPGPVAKAAVESVTSGAHATRA